MIGLPPAANSASALISVGGTGHTSSRLVVLYPVRVVWHAVANKMAVAGQDLVWLNIDFHLHASHYKRKGRPSLWLPLIVHGVQRNGLASQTRQALG